jgi:general secretion pathway protein G
VAPAFFGIQKKSEIDAAKAQIGMFRTALQHYRLTNGTYPTTEQGLQALLTPPTTEPVPKNWAGPYLEANKSLVDPWGTPYYYRYPGQHGLDEPDIWSAGPDRQSGTDDDITSWSTE